VPIPSYSSLMLPLLQLAGDGVEHTVTEAIDTLAEYTGLTAEERAELTPSGSQFKFNYRVHCANTYLKRAGLLESTGRGAFHITAQGTRVLQSNPLHINRAFLMQFPSFADFITRSRPERAADADPVDYLETEHTPKELIHILYSGLQKELIDELLDYVLSASPAFFEKLVVDLLLAMGYGSSRDGAGKTLGRSGDGGLDGYIQEDKLGLDVVYIQAKRYARNNPIGRPLIQGFVGSLIGAGANRGVFITTSRFSKEAVEYARSMQNHKVILIDGNQLTKLMLEHGIGVSVEAMYVLHRLDRDYFDME
jgi:restriction system protein